MGINYINTGTGPNSGNADSIRTAFNKVNDNFRFVNSASVINLAAVNADIIPAVGSTFNLGSTSTSWQNVFVSNGSLYLDNSSLSVSGGLLLINGHPVSNTNQGLYTTSSVSFAAISLGNAISITNVNGMSANDYDLVYNPNVFSVGTSTMTLDTFSTSVYRGAKYLISVGNTGTNQYQMSEILLIQDGVTANFDQVSIFSNGSGVIIFATSLVGGTVSLLATGTCSTCNNVVKVQGVYMAI